MGNINQVFDQDFIDSVLACIKDACGDGRCITAGNLAIAVGLSDEDHLLIRDLCKRNLSEEVDVRMGPNGGFFLKSVPPKKKEKPMKSSGMEPEFIASVQGMLDQLFRDTAVSVISPTFVAARLNLSPQTGARLINEALKSGKLNGYVSKRGRGIIQGNDANADND